MSFSKSWNQISLCCRLHEIILLLKTLTLRRFFNAAKLRISWLVAVVLGRIQIWGKPEAISIEPATTCNLHCPECPVGNATLKRSSTYLMFTDFRTVIDKVAPWCQYLSLYFQGESFMNKSIVPMIRYAKEKNIFVAIATNGHFFNDTTAEKVVRSKLDKLIISLDGATEDIYSRYRIGGNFNTVVSGIKKIIEWKKRLNTARPLLVIQFIVFKHNEHQINDMKNMVANLGNVRLEIKTAQIYGLAGKQNLLPKNPKLSRYYIDDAQLHIKSKLPNRCWRMWHSAVITAQGYWVPCCFDKDANFTMGNIISEDLNKIWKNKLYQQFRIQIFRNRKAIDMCRNCTENLKI